MKKRTKKALIFYIVVSKETDFIQIKVALGNWPSLDHLKVLFGHWLRFYSFSVQSLYLTHLFSLPKKTLYNK